MSELLSRVWRWLGARWAAFFLSPEPPLRCPCGNEGEGTYRFDSVPRDDSFTPCDRDGRATDDDSPFLRCNHCRRILDLELRAAIGFANV